MKKGVKVLEEIWKDIVIEKNGKIYDYTGLYQISNLGRVKTLNYKRTKEHKVLKAKITRSGYEEVQLSKNKEHTMFFVHRLVATMFIPNNNNYPQVNHIDENKLNNTVSNLEWCSAIQNANHGTRNRRTTEKKKGVSINVGENNSRSRKVICLETGEVFPTVKSASEWCQGDVGGNCRGKQKYAGSHPVTKEKLHWKFYDGVENEE